MSDMFCLVSQTHIRATQSSINGDLAIPNAKLRRNALSYQGSKLYNDCDPTIEMADTMQTFKHRYYEQYFSNM